MPFAMFNPCEPCCEEAVQPHPCNGGIPCYLLTYSSGEYHLKKKELINEWWSAVAPAGELVWAWQCRPELLLGDMVLSYYNNSQTDLLHMTLISYDENTGIWIYRDDIGLHLPSGTIITITPSSDNPCEDQPDGGGGEGTIETVCCPDRLLPTTLFLTMTSNNCLCMNFSAELVYSAGNAEWSVNIPNQCGTKDINFRLFCSGGIEWHTALTCDGLVIGLGGIGGITSQCEPFLIESSPTISFDPGGCCFEGANISYTITE